MVALWLQQQWIHIGVARNASRLGLDSLGTTDFKAFGGGIGVQRHILGLEWGGAIAVLLKNAAKSRSNDALAHIAARSGKHHWMQSFHGVILFR